MIIFTKPNCYPCMELKRQLKERGIRYTEVDVTARDFDNNKEKIYSVPTIQVGERRYRSLKEYDGDSKIS